MKAPHGAKRAAGPFVVLRALAIGAAGGALFSLFSLPLAWLLGAMLFTTVAAFARVRLGMPPGARVVMMIILGIMIGSTFTPALLAGLPNWPFSLATLVALLAVSGGLVWLFLHRAGRLDTVTAYFCATPGGMAEMILVGGAMGADVRTVGLIHATRIFLVVMVVPFWFRLTTDIQPLAAGSAASLGDVVPADMVLLAAAGAVGYVLARRLRLPAAEFLGPLVASAGVHLAGLSAAQPPWELVAAAQVVIGIAIGARFAGTDIRYVPRILALALGSTSILLAAAILGALALAGITDLPFPALLLAFTPGGLAEMSLVALALGIDAAFVSSHNVVRIILVIALAPLLFGLIRRRLRPTRAGDR